MDGVEQTSAKLIARSLAARSLVAQQVEDQLDLDQSQVQESLQKSVQSVLIEKVFQSQKNSRSQLVFHILFIIRNFASQINGFSDPIG